MSGRKSVKKKKDKIAGEEEGEEDEEFAVGQRPSSDSEDEEVIVPPTPRSSRKRGRKEMEGEDVGPVKQDEDYDEQQSYFLPFSSSWTPHSLYRLPCDIVATVIRESGSEGESRIGIGQRLGMDASIKTGNRRVSGFIQHVTKQFPLHIGQFQKMEGKYRTIKYFWKEAAQPARFTAIYEQFEELIGRPCPFKMGQVIKFPDSPLSTLRLSDVSLNRLLLIVKFVHEQSIIVTVHRLIKLLQTEEEKMGYIYQIDKKSVLKCLCALKKEKLLKVFEKEIADEKISIITHYGVEDADDAEVALAIRATVDEYNREHRIFPHGQYRYGNKLVKAVGEEDNAKMDNKLLEEMGEELNERGELTMEKRYDLYRLQMSRLQMERKKENAVKKDLGVELGNELGYQSKMLRCMVMHQITYHFTYGLPDDARPTVFEMFPPGKVFRDWKDVSTEELTVFVDKESPLRFMPPCQYESLPPGWFMVQDLMAALPVSVFALVCKGNTKLQALDIELWLNDSLKRHTPIGCLPTPLRCAIMTDKKSFKQVEHVCLLLCVMGVMVVGKCASSTRFPFSACTLFCVLKKGELYDTSTSEKGYSCVSLPIERYARYEYDFSKPDGLCEYWQHLRAIVHSTPLSYRSEVPEDYVNENARAFSIGTVDKARMARPLLPPIEADELPLQPVGKRNGVAAFDAALFAHLPRHWEPNARPASHWFHAQCSREIERVRARVESRVERVEPLWNSYIRSFMPTDMQLLRNKKAFQSKMDAGETTYSGSIRTSLVLALEPKKKKKDAGAPKPASKKRPLDTVDLLSEKNKLHIRSRFNPKEKDMLILIRAVGFFLNPVYRFWLNPAVLRDIMHEFVPESRTKTVQSLMAAGVREMARPNRLAYLQRIVRNLSTFPEMRSIRCKLAATPLTEKDDKTEFFKGAFRVAQRLLFSDSHRVPGVSASEKTFDDFLRSGTVTLSVQQQNAQQRPLRSQAPTSLEHLHHCVAANVLLSTLLHTQSQVFPEGALSQLSASALHNALQTFRTDGLVSKLRNPEVLHAGKNKHHATLSYYFRTFFSHRFHPDIVDLTRSEINRVEELETATLEDDHVGVVMASLASFYGKKEMMLNVEDSILEMFESVNGDNEHTVTKQIRQLEGTNLHLEKMEVALFPEEFVNTTELCVADREEMRRLADRPLPSIDTLLATFDHSFSIPSPIPTIDDLVHGHTAHEALIIRSLYDVLEKAGVYGVKRGDLEVSDEHIRCLSILQSKSAVFHAGVDELRWVLMQHATAWTVEMNGGVRHNARPWLHPAGHICPSTVRWMAESVLVSVISQPGIVKEALVFRFEFALSPVCVEELVRMLVRADCVEMRSEPLKEMKLKGPFDDDEDMQGVTYLMPTLDAIERFSRIFGAVPLLPSILPEAES